MNIESNKARAMARKYALARHHAWGGLGLISLISVIRILHPPLPDMFFFPILVLLILYVLFWLAMTYRFRSGLMAETAPVDTLRSLLNKNCTVIFV